MNWILFITECRPNQKKWRASSFEFEADDYTLYTSSVDEKQRTGWRALGYIPTRKFTRQEPEL